LAPEGIGTAKIDRCFIILVPIALLVPRPHRLREAKRAMGTRMMLYECVWPGTEEDREFRGQAEVDCHEEES